MAKSSIEAYGAHGEFKGLIMAPEDITIVGVDCPDETCPELADPDRVHLPLDPGMIASIQKHGVREPVTIRKIGDTVYAENGRRRILHARAVNEAGADPPILLRCQVAAKGSDPTLGLVIPNEHRQDDGIIARARKAERLLARGVDLDDVAAAFGVSKQTVGNWLALLELPKPLQAKVSSGQIPATAARELSKLEPAERDARAAELVTAAEAGPVRGRKAEALARGTKPPKDGAKSLPAKTVRALHARFEPTDSEPLEDEFQELTAALLKVLIGDDPTGKGLKRWPTVHKHTKKILRSEAAGT